MKTPTNHKSTKSNLHPRSKHRQHYNFERLISNTPELKSYVSENKYGNLSIDFFNPNAVKTLNKALLKTHYNISFWDIPDQYLCPPIPGRADYIHYIADLFGDTNFNKKIKGLDIGTGANCIYPLIGNKNYGWQFIATDVDETAINWAKEILAKNKLEDHIILRFQKNKHRKLSGILKSEEFIDFMMCNPPFHASAEEAKKATTRKLKNLKNKNPKAITLNFGGQHNELWCKGGEARFIKDLIFESKRFASQCKWFTTLVSKGSHLKPIYKHLKTVDVKETRTIEMGQGQKVSRIVAWRFQ